MKNVGNKVKEIFFKKLNLSDIEYQYYSGGLCGDLYLNKKDNLIFKIVLWHIKTDNLDRLNEKYNKKLKFIEFLHKKNFPLIGIAQVKQKLFYTLELEGSLYVAYFMPFITIDKEYAVSIKEQASFIERFHELSKEYCMDKTNNEWLEDLESVLYINHDKFLENKLLKYKQKILDMQNESRFYIHNDLTSNNIVQSNGGLKMIDIDTITFGFPLLDISHYCFDYSIIDFFKNKYKSKQEIYTFVKEFLSYFNTPYSIEDVETMLQYYRVYFFAISQNRIKEDNINIYNQIKEDIFNDKTFML